MSLSAAIATAQTGLAARNRELGVTSSNIANALTEGYARKEVTLSAIATTGGVRVETVENAAAPTLRAERRMAEADAAFAGVSAEGLEGIAAAIGELGDPDTLADRLTAFESGLSALQTRPFDTGLQRAAIDAARGLTAYLNRASSALDRLMLDGEETLTADIETANRLIDQLATAPGNRGGDPADVAAALEGDATAAALDELNALFPGLKLTPSGDGDGILSLETGTLIVQPLGPATLEVRTDAATGARSLWLDAGDVETEIDPGASGAIAGRLGFLEATLPEMQERLDTLAADLVDAFADPGTDPSLAPGNYGLFTDRLAPPAVTEGLAGRIGVNEALDDPAESWRIRDGIGAATPGPEGDDTLVRAFLAALDAAPPSGSGPADARLVTVGAAISRDVSSLLFAAREDGIVADTRRSAAAAAEGRAVGVDDDAELQRLALLQRAYQANAEVIRTSLIMLDTLLEL
ncbi:MAG: flagellar basal body protein [Pseudomonadota bacterium]